MRLELLDSKVKGRSGLSRCVGPPKATFHNMTDKYRIGICSESVTVHVAMDLMLKDQVTVDGRAVSVERFDPSKPWQGLVIDAWRPCQQGLAYDLSQAHASRRHRAS